MTKTKAEIIKAGTEMCNRSTPVQQENHKKVLAWIETLSEYKIPDYSHHAEGREAGAVLGYKLLIREWVAATNVNTKN